MPLSSRAQRVATSNANSLMWDIMGNGWSETNPTGFLNLGVAENFLMHDELLRYINTTLDLDPKYLTYNDGGGGSNRLRAALADFMNRHFEPFTDVKPEHVVATNGVSSAVEQLSWCFADPGEGILLGRPFYGTFIPDLTVRPESAVVPVSFDDVDPLSRDAVQKYEDALLAFQQSSGKKVKALLLCHPHNPLGRCYPREVLVELMRLCQKYQIHLVSDEIYALSVWTNTVDYASSTSTSSSNTEVPEAIPFASALSINTEGIIDRSLVHVLWGMSKDFGANGLRLGAIVSQSNSSLHDALKGTTLYSYPSGVSEHLVTRILEDRQFTDSYIKTNQERLSQSYAFTVGWLRERGIKYAGGCNAAFFLWVDLGKKYLELHPDQNEKKLGEVVMQRLLDNRVFLASGALFGSEKDGWFRIVFSHPREYLEMALERMMHALED